MATPVIILKMGQQMESGIIRNWFVKEGDFVRENDPLFEMETDKVTAEVSAPASGIITIVNGELGIDLPVGEAVAFIKSEGEQAEQEESKQAKTNPEPKRIIASPYARKLAHQHGLDLSKITPSMGNGRIIAKDVQEYVSWNLEPVADHLEIPLSSMRKAILTTLQKSAESIVPVTITRTVQVDQLVQFRQQFKEDGLSASPHDFIFRAVSKGLQKHKYLNAAFADDRIIQYKEINIGFAVAAGDGLMIPVIRQCNEKSVQEIARERKRLVELTRQQKLTLEDCDNGSFTISSLGEYGVDSFSPVIFPGQACILGVGGIQKKPVVKADALDIGYLLQLSLVFDHRVCDGAPAAEFLKDVCEWLEHPLRLLIEI